MTKLGEKAKALSRKAQARYKTSRAVKRQEILRSRASGRKVRFSKSRLIAEIMTEARVLNRHMGAAEIVAEKVANEVERWAKDKTTITEDDITRVAGKKLEKYDKDLSYIYQNRGTII